MEEDAVDECIGSNTQSSCTDTQPTVEPSDKASKRKGSENAVVKRKTIKPRSKAWDHFEKILDENGMMTLAKCLHCGKLFYSHSRKNGTSSLLSHMDSCMKNPHIEQTKQALLSLQPKNGDGTGVGVGTLSSWKYDYEAIREAVAYMIIVDELPFKFVEGDGFKRVMNRACPKFNIPSRWTVSRDCFDLYATERLKLKSFMKNNCQRICLTTDTWTSLQKINYMCITAHYIDNGWNLHKKILNFILVISHWGNYIGKAIETCVLDWGLKNVFTITVDNASSNDTAISFLKKKTLNWGGSVASCKYLHMRCIAHIINLVVSEGMKDVNPSIKRVRDAIRYIRSSPTRIRKFKECAEFEGIECKSSLCLDVATRWNSTYLMIKTAAQFEKAFDRYQDQEANFVSNLGECGVPSCIDWACANKMADLLSHFYELTLRISGSLYVTSHSFFNEISDLCCILNEWKDSNDIEVRRLGESTKSKFDKYWGNPDKMNKMIFWANIFDPRDKLEYMDYSLGEMYGTEIGGKFVKDELFELFIEYKNKYLSENDALIDNSLSSSSSGGSRPSCSNFSGSEISSKPRTVLKTRYKKQIMANGSSVSKKSELDVYLEQAIVEEGENFDVLKWWKLNSERFPVLSKMARDILAVPISTVASESAFSTSGRVLGVFRSSLAPKVMEALICAQDWFRTSKSPISIEELVDDLENFEKDLPAVGTGLS